MVAPVISERIVQSSESATSSQLVHSNSAKYSSNLVSKWHNSLSTSLVTSDAVLSETETTTAAAVESVNTSPYSKVDKTGFIGFFANIIEIAIDFGHDIINKLGVQNSYGFSIILFTVLRKYLLISNVSLLCIKFTNLF